MTRSELVLRYAVFAALSTTANLTTQWVVMQTWTGPWRVALAVLAGTAVGIPIKYVLDKRYIFFFAPASMREDGRVFVLYLAMAVVTTLVFWGTELVFHVLVGTDGGRLVGGALGLAAGYLLKYELDRRFVFVERTEESVPG